MLLELIQYFWNENQNWKIKKRTNKVTNVNVLFMFDLQSLWNDCAWLKRILWLERNNSCNIQPDVLIYF